MKKTSTAVWLLLTCVGFAEITDSQEEPIEQMNSRLPSLFSGDANDLPEKQSDPSKWHISKDGSSTLWEGTVGNLDISIKAENTDPIPPHRTEWEKSKQENKWPEDTTPKNQNHHWDAKENRSSEIKCSIDWPSKH